MLLYWGYLLKIFKKGKLINLNLKKVKNLEEDAN
jgi:hypothetical protein